MLSVGHSLSPLLATRQHTLLEVCRGAKEDMPQLEGKREKWAQGARISFQNISPPGPENLGPRFYMSLWEVAFLALNHENIGAKKSQ